MLKITDYNSKMGQTSHSAGGSKMEKMHKLGLGMSYAHILLFRMREYTYTEP